MDSGRAVVATVATRWPRSGSSRKMAEIWWWNASVRVQEGSEPCGRATANGGGPAAEESKHADVRIWGN